MRTHTRSNRKEEKNKRQISTIQMGAIALNNEHYKQINQLKNKLTVI